MLSAKGSFVLFNAAVACALVFGWSIRPEEYLTAEEGLGYYLGIIGGVLMLSQLLYTLRKNNKKMRNWGKLTSWFRVHMIVGVVGPIIILYHSNFGLGSLNSNIAFFSMLFVAGSGVVGRYMYTKLHHGLYGHSTELSELKKASQKSKEEIDADVSVPANVKHLIEVFENKVYKPDDNWIIGTWDFALLGFRYRWTRSVATKKSVAYVLSEGQKKGWDKARLSEEKQAVKLHVSRCIYNIRRIVEFSNYTKLFALWHVLHIPLFIMMVVAGIFHVVAVHMY